LLIVNEELTCIVKATLDSEGHLPILWVSNNFEKLFGYGKQDAMGMSVKELMPASFAVPHGVAVEAWR
jgi:PAS domain S-box-containing protein